MKNALKGALLSGLVLPGLGQVALRCYKRGIVLILAVLTAVSLIVVKAVEQAFVILEKIESTGRPADMEAIVSAAGQSVSTADHMVISLSFLMIILIWLVGIADAYFTGRKMDREDGL